MICRSTAGKLLIFGLSAILMLNIALSQTIIESLVLFGGLFLVVIFLFKPQWGLFLIVFIRPSIDRFSENLSINTSENAKFNAAAVFGVLVISLLLVYVINHRRVFQQIHLRKSWLFFILICIFSLFFSIKLSASLYELVRLLSIFLIFLSFYILALENQNPKILLSALVFSGILPFFYASYQLLTHTGLGGTTGVDSRLFGTFSHPNPFASFILISLVAAIYLAYHETLSQKKWLYFSYIAWAIFLLIETYSRGAWLAFMLFLLILGLIKSPKMVMMMALFCVILFFSSETIQYRVEDIYNPPADSSVRWRFAQWDRMYKVFLKRPMIGQGIGTETYAHQMEYGYNAGNQYTHNDFLRIAVEIGVPGLLAYWLLISLTLMLLYQSYRSASNHTWLKDYKLFVLALFVAIVSFSQTNNTLRETVTQWTTWGLIGTALALSEPKIIQTNQARKTVLLH